MKMREKHGVHMIFTVYKEHTPCKQCGKTVTTDIENGKRSFIHQYVVILMLSKKNLILENPAFSGITAANPIFKSDKVPP